MFVNDYIQQHDDICYCEAIIYPDGSIEDAQPSHVEKLISICEESRQEINNKMPFDASPLAWLVDYTKCVSLWYNSCYLPENLTNQQIATITELIKNNIISNQYLGIMSKELSITNRNKNYANGGNFYEIKKRKFIFTEDLNKNIKGVNYEEN